MNGPDRDQPLDEQPMPEASIARRKQLPAELCPHRPDDRGAGEDDSGPLRLEADHRPPLVGAPGAEQLDQPVELVDVELAPPARPTWSYVASSCFTAEVRHGAAHRDNTGRRAAIEQRDSAAIASSATAAPSRRRRRRGGTARSRAAPPTRTRPAPRCALRAERELRAAAAGLEHDQQPSTRSMP